MKRANRMCNTCPFRGISEAERYELAVVDPEDWPCHTEHPLSGGETQCRGHYEARRKYPPKPHEVENLRKWQSDILKLPIGQHPEAPLRDPMQQTPKASLKIAANTVGSED